MKMANSIDLCNDNNMDDAIDLTVIVTAHAEGLLLHKTLRSIKKAATLLRDKYTYEIIVHLDNPTSETVDYVKQHKDLEGFTAYANNFGEPAKSRNYAASRARGKFIAFIDGDDLVSEGYFLRSMNILEHDEECIVHPEYTIVFEAANMIWRKNSSGNKVLDTLRFIGGNMWDMPCILARSLFLKHTYRSNTGAFVYEDKLFNTDTLAAGIRHVVVPKTILFVRRKYTASVLRAHNASGVDIALTELFNFDWIKSLDINRLWDDAFKPGNSYAANIISPVKKYMTAFHRFNKKTSRVYRRTYYFTKERILGSEFLHKKSRYPDWLLKEWTAIHDIEQSIHPSQNVIERQHWYTGDNNIIPGLLYAKLTQSLSVKPDTIFFVPWLIKGGADKVFINYINELSDRQGRKVLVLQTETKRSVWKNKLSKNVDFIDLTDFVQLAGATLIINILTTFVIQNNIKRVFIGNSRLGYNFIYKNKPLVTEQSIAVYPFVFCQDFDAEGFRKALVHTKFPHIYDVSYKAITDNKGVVDLLVDEYAFDRSRFVVHYQPAHLDIEDTTHTDNKVLRVLWASRVSQQKRPDILKAVAEKLSDRGFSFDAYGQLEGAFTEKFFENSKVNYKGPYNGSDSLPYKEYDVYLYTSESDGIPNVLQELTAHGLPIVASNVGGIGEFINQDTGILIDEYENADAYVNALERMKSFTLRKKLNKNAQKLLTSTFTIEAWRYAFKRDIDR